MVDDTGTMNLMSLLRSHVNSLFLCPHREIILIEIIHEGKCHQCHLLQTSLQVM